MTAVTEVGVTNDVTEFIQTQEETNDVTEFPQTQQETRGVDHLVKSHRYFKFR